MQNFLILRELQTEFLKFKTHFAKISYKKTECMTDFMHFLVFFWPIELKFFMGTQETIIYRLVLKNLGFGPYLLFSIFWVLTKGVAPQGPQNPTKNLTHLVEILGHLLSRNHVSNFFDLGTDAANHLTHLYFFL